MLNKVLMLGNLTRDVEHKTLSSGSAVAKFSIAVSFKYKDRQGDPKEEVCYIDVNTYGKQAEIASQYLKKGSKVLVEGRLVLEQWLDGASGQKRSKHTLSCESFQMLGQKESEAPSHYYEIGNSSTNEPKQQETGNPSYVEPKKLDTPQQQISLAANGSVVGFEGKSFDVLSEEGSKALVRFIEELRATTPTESLSKLSQDISKELDSINGGSFLCTFDNSGILIKIDEIPF